MACRTQNLQIAISALTELLLLLILSIPEVEALEDVFLNTEIGVQEPLSLLSIALLVLLDQISQLIFIQYLFVLIYPLEFALHPA